MWFLFLDEYIDFLTISNPLAPGKFYKNSLIASIKTLSFDDWLILNNNSNLFDSLLTENEPSPSTKPNYQYLVIIGLLGILNSVLLEFIPFFKLIIFVAISLVTLSLFVYNSKAFF